MPANPARVVYGTIVVATLLAAESAQRETYLKTVIAVVIAILIYWLAHSYAESAAQRIETGSRLNARELADSLLHEAPILAGAAIPMLSLLVWWVVGASLTNAVSAAIWTAAGMIVVFELIAGVRAKLTGVELIVQTLMGAALGCLVIALKLVLH
jgi:hypothetical protein